MTATRIFKLIDLIEAQIEQRNNTTDPATLANIAEQLACDTKELARLQRRQQKLQDQADCSDC
jgi:hypothetical protein